MSLSLYEQKRNFSQTPEPKGKEKPSKNELRFVVQKHDASGLHYDFRLEMESVLKSWAVPKGPSLNPTDKRLAMMVEDHPYDYRTFEGVIPEGNYGAGTVIVWDEGTYEVADAEGLSKAEQEKKLLKGLESGSLKFVLHGKKLKGAFTLFQVKRDKEGKTWLLVKKGDEYAAAEDITEQNTSVKSGKTLAEVAAENGVVLNHPEEKTEAVKPTAERKRKVPAKKASHVAEKNNKQQTAPPSGSSIKVNKDPEQLLGKAAPLAKKTVMPKKLKPMLATLADEPFDNAQWLFEIKWDGYRAVAYCNAGKVEIISRNEKPFTGKYAPITQALQQLNIQAVLDGEIVAVDEKGLANFQLLQNWQNTPQARLQYFIFDILWLDGYDVTALPLIERKRILQTILPADHEQIKYSDHVVENGRDFFKVAIEQGLEGIMAKRSNSRYTVNSRTDDWLKIKVAQRQEVVIAGFTQPRNSRKFLGALLLGVYDGDELVYVGHTGSGFTRKNLEEVWKKLQPLIIDYCPFKECPRGNMPTTWVQPKLVCEIKFTEWTKERMARHPIFMGLREDKKAEEVTFEKTKTIASMVKRTTTKKADAAIIKKSAPEKPAAPGKATTKKSTAKSKNSGLELTPDEGTEQIIKLDGHELKLTNLDKLYWKKENYSKLDLINYYLKIAPFILPYMLDRPQSLHRYPNGINAPHFFQKDVKGKVPEWMTTQQDFSESTDETVHYLVCSNEATLIYMANLGCIEMH
ncbi:MAG: DNA ligase D, partial [Bacteroidota bacterium]|nr:DNA ligase D [Bacteroidota bacterium]